MAMQSSGQIKWSEIQSTHGGSNPINISEYYGKYYSSGGDRRPTSGEQKASYLFSTSPSVNGDWSSWGDWSSCSVSCGGGTQTRSRTCSNPSATYGGSDCSGSTSDSQSCNTDSCGPYEYNTNGTYTWTPPYSGTVDVVIYGAGIAMGGTCYFHGCSSCARSVWDLRGATTSALGGSASGSYADNTACASQYATGTARGSSTFSTSVTGGTGYTIVLQGGFEFQSTKHGYVSITYQ